MNFVFTPKAWEDYQYWIANDRKTLKRLNKLIEDAARSPFEGLGKPEPLKHALTGYWSRRITGEHRLVYESQEGRLVIISCRYHY